MRIRLVRADRDLETVRRAHGGRALRATARMSAVRLAAGAGAGGAVVRIRPKAAVVVADGQPDQAVALSDPTADALSAMSRAAVAAPALALFVATAVWFIRRSIR